ncbi:MAG: hypothetical protein ABT940_08140 [Alphaproteobacteria bacterium]
MTLIGLVTAALLGVSWAAAAGPAAGSPPQAAPPLVLPLPDGYCPLLGGTPQESRYLSFLTQANAGSNMMLKAFAECGELSAFREGKIKGLTHHGQYLATLTGGVLTTVPSGTRDSVLSALEQALPRLDMASLSKKVTGKDADKEVTARQGIIDRDDAAVYLATFSERRSREGQTAGEGTESFAGLTAITVLRGYMVSLNLYRPYDGQATFEKLSAELRPMVRSALANNGVDGPGNPPSASTDRPQGAESEASSLEGDTIIGGGLLIAGGVLAWWLARRRRDIS